MKLCTFETHPGAQPRVGAACVVSGGSFVIDLAQAQAHQAGMIELLRAGEPGLAAARRAVDHVHGLVATAGIDAALAQGVLRPMAGCRLQAPIERPGKIISVGANYHDHIQEGRHAGALDELPPYPPAFLKMSSAVVGPDAVVPYPADTDELDYEVELCVVIGRACQDVPAQRWREVVAGFTIANDLSRRDLILREKDSGIVLQGKNFPGACPLGPYLVTTDEIADPSDLAIGLRVNGHPRQQDRTSSMVHGLDEIVAYWSRLGLEPGDVITTGTPGGVAGFRKQHPERLLQPGDVVEAEIEGLGVLRTHIGPPAARP